MITEGPWGLEWAHRETHPLLAHSRIRSEAINEALQPFITELQNATNILDVGSGGGVQIYFPEINPNNITAMDITPGILEKNPALIKKLADANKTFPFDSEQFDVVTQFFLNRYLPDQVNNFREIHRVLKTNGRFIIMDHSQLHHSEEVSIFNPRKLLSLSHREFRDVLIEEISPAIPFKYASGVFRGPVYIFSAVKR